MKTNYISLMESETFQDKQDFFAADPRHTLMVETVANALFHAWFPRAESGHKPVGEDFQNWHEIACDDAQVAVEAMLKTGWLTAE